MAWALFVLPGGDSPMAQKPLRPCRHPGCCILVPDGYCAAHKPKDRRSAEAKSWHWMYLTPEWLDDLRPSQLLKEPFCRECAQRGIRTRTKATGRSSRIDAICKAYAIPAIAAKLWRKSAKKVLHCDGGTGPD